MTIETHYDETPAENSNALPPGTYRARAQSWAWDTTKNGDPCIALMFELLDGKPGYQIDGRLYLDESKPDAKGRTAHSRSMEALHAMGLQGDLTADLAGIDQGEVNLVTDINEKGYACVKWMSQSLFCWMRFFGPRGPHGRRRRLPPVSIPVLLDEVLRPSATPRTRASAARCLNPCSVG